MEADGNHLLADYLTNKDDAALEFKRGRVARDPGDVPDGDEPTYLRFVSDYGTTVKVEQERVFARAQPGYDVRTGGRRDARACTTIPSSARCCSRRNVSTCVFVGVSPSSVPRV